MADIINLRLARKQKARLDRDRQAAQNRALHGRPKIERDRQRAETAKLHDHVEAHRRESDRDQ